MQRVHEGKAWSYCRTTDDALSGTRAHVVERRHALKRLLCICECEVKGIKKHIFVPWAQASAQDAPSFPAKQDGSL